MLKKGWYCFTARPLLLKTVRPVTAHRDGRTGRVDGIRILGAIAVWPRLADEVEALDHLFGGEESVSRFVARIAGRVAVCGGICGRRAWSAEIEMCVIDAGVEHRDDDAIAS